ncbi:MAG: protein kinase [Verrucomicrobiales bacterium]
MARGGMGSVIEAEDRKLGRTVALKVMAFDAFSDEGLRQRFVREAHILARLAHPNIVPIYDIVWEDGSPQFYTMKLVRGHTLQEILDGLSNGDSEILNS